VRNTFLASILSSETVCASLRLVSGRILERSFVQLSRPGRADEFLRKDGFGNQILKESMVRMNDNTINVNVSRFSTLA
jgi:hypothetical protein